MIDPIKLIAGLDKIYTGHNCGYRHPHDHLNFECAIADLRQALVEQTAKAALLQNQSSDLKYWIDDVLRRVKEAK